MRVIERSPLARCSRTIGQIYEGTSNMQLVTSAKQLLG